VSATIREARLEDVELLASIHAECFRESWDAQAFRALLERPGCFALATGAEHVLEAFILIQLAGDEAEIQSLGTRDKFRRKGLARALVEGAAAESFRRGARAMFLEVAEDNGAGLALYRRLSFTEAGRRRGYYPRGKDISAADALVLRANLPLIRG
jgi:[ribosomal protein S18]-alanine N-acetyltransferase